MTKDAIAQVKCNLTPVTDMINLETPFTHNEFHRFSIAI